MRLRSLSGLCFGSLALLALASACGSDDGKKKAGPEYQQPDGGAGGDPSTAGKSGSRNDAGGEPGGTTGAGGSGEPGRGGAGGAAMPGDAGAGGTAPGELCGPGFDDCDDDHSDCETPIDTVTACGACDVSCDGSHGSVSCVEAKCSVDSCAAGYDDCDDDATTGCESKLDSATHCGACTRDCAAVGATCTTGMCSVVSYTATGQSYDWAFAGGAAFFMKVNAIPPSHYTMTRVPLDGSAEKQIWDAAAAPGSGTMYADATHLYWSVWGTPPSVLRKAISAATGDNPEVLFQPLRAPRYLTIRGGAFFWMTGMYNEVATLFTRATNAAPAVIGTEIMSVDQHYVSAFTSTTDALYWVARNVGSAILTTVPLGGGAPVAVPDAVVVDTAPLYAVGDTLYFARTGNANVLNGIYRFKQGDATVTQLVQQESVNSLIVDDTGLYYRSGYADNIVYKSPLSGGAGVPLAKVQGGFGGFVGQDEKLLYTYHQWGSSGPAFKIVK